MTEAAIDCPVCGQEGAISFYEGTENGAPHGAGYWPMQVSETNQDCDCDLTEAQMTELANTASEPLQKQYDAYAEEMAEMYDPANMHADGVWP